MFDDLKQDQNQVGTSPVSPNSTGQSVAPTKSAIDDMFSSTDPAPVSDTLDKPSAIQSGLVKPVGQTKAPEAVARPSTPVNMPSQPSGPMPPADMSVASSGGGLKKIFIILIAIIMVATVSFAIYYFFFRDSGGDKVVMENKNSTVVNENTNETPTPTDDDLDDDSDGLSNAEERRLGTDPLETDTDNDGLFDREEVKSFKTDPTKADTDGDGLSDYSEIKVWFTNPFETDSDGDGYSDGEEVINGYDPLGTGSLDNVSGDVEYITYVEQEFGYSIAQPDNWVDIYDKKEEPVFYTSVDFLPNVGSAEYISVRVIKVDYGSQEEFKNILPTEFTWEDYTLNGKPAYRSRNKGRVMAYLPPENEMSEGRVYTLAYEGREFSGGVYLGIFQYMLDNFYFPNN